MNNNKILHLLIDGDIVYHKAVRRKRDDGNPVEFDEVKEYITSNLDWLARSMNADKMTVFLSCRSADNFRKTLFETYKGDRTDRPPLLDEAKQFIIDNYHTRMEPTIEADDLLGIWSTEPQDEELRVIVSIDKDLEQIPGFLFNNGKADQGVKEINHVDAEKRFYFQWMTGDQTDSYPGVPGVGPKKAEKLMEDIQAKFEELEELVSFDELMQEAIFALFKKHSLTYEYALTQARMARILRHGDYDFETKKVKLWEPIWR